MFADRFEASAADIQRATAWAGKQNLEIVASPANRLLDVFCKKIGQKRPATKIAKVPVNGFVDNNSGASGGEGENILDITNVLGAAHKLDAILFYEGARNSIATILDKIASDNKASVISNSWIYEDDNSAQFKEFQAQGQSFVNASGDYGAYDDCTSGEPSANPYAVPGFDLATGWGNQIGPALINGLIAPRSSLRSVQASQTHRLGRPGSNGRSSLDRPVLIAQPS